MGVYPGKAFLPLLSAPKSPSPCVTSGEIPSPLKRAGRKSNSSLYSSEMATFEEDNVYNQKDAEGFIKLNALRLKLLKNIT